MSLKTCAADKCRDPETGKPVRFQPYCIDQIYCSDRCRIRMGVRAHRNRLKHGGDDGGPGGGGKRRQMTLFAKPESVSAKRVKRAQPETAPLFAMFPNGKHEKHVPIIDPQLCVLPVIGHELDQPIPPAVEASNPGGLDAAA
jgi:hypothetical protein